MGFSARRFFFLTIFCSLAFLVSYFLAIYLLWPTIGEYRMLKEYIVAKDLAVKRIGDSRKIIFGGGSGTLFGIRAKDVERAFAIPSVNVAFHGGLDLDYIIYTTKKAARKGDIVILPLEYEHFLYDGGTNSFKASALLSSDRGYFLHCLSFRQELEYLAHVIAFNKVFKTVRRYRARRAVSWWIGALNERGDITGNKGNRDIGRVNPEGIQKGDFKETVGLSLIRKLGTWARERDITLYVSYANCIYLKDYESKEYATYFDNLRRYFLKNNIRVLGTPYDFFYPARLFYDTAYHMNEEGVTLRTERLIRMLRDVDPKTFEKKS